MNTRRFATAGLVLTIGLSAGGCLRLGSDTAAVRSAVMSAVPDAGAWDEKIELSLGALSMSLARTITRFTDIPPEGRAALQSARSVEVGVYEFHGAAAASSRPAMLAEATATLEARGWARIVAVVDGKDIVAVFTPEEDEPRSSVKLCVVVFDGHELVVAAARVRPEPLVAMLKRQHRLLPVDETPVEGPV